MRRVTVPLPDRDYEVVVGNGGIERGGILRRGKGGGRRQHQQGSGSKGKTKGHGGSPGEEEFVSTTFRNVRLP